MQSNARGPKTKPQSARSKNMLRRILYIYVLPVVFFMMLTAALAGWYAERTLSENESRSLQNALDLQARQIEFWFSMFEDTLMDRRDYLEGADYAPEDIQRFLNAAYAKDRGTASVYFMDAKAGRIIAPAGQQDIDEDPSSQEWYNSALDSDQVIYSRQRFLPRSGMEVITLSLRVAQGSELMGVLALDVPVAEVDRMLDSIQLKQMGIPMLVDLRDGTIIASQMVRFKQHNIHEYASPGQISLPQGGTGRGGWRSGASGSGYHITESRMPRLTMTLTLLQDQDNAGANSRNLIALVVLVAAGGTVLMVLLYFGVARLLMRGTVESGLRRSVSAGNLLDAMLDTHYVSVILTDERMKLLYASAAVAELCGVSDWRALRGRYLLEALPAPELQAFVSGFLNGDQAAPRRELFSIQGQDGRRRYLNMSIQALSEGDVLVNYLFLFTDETDNTRKDAMLDAMLEAPDSYIAVFDRAHVVSLMSTAMATHLRWPGRAAAEGHMVFEDLPDMGIPADQISAAREALLQKERRPLLINPDTRKDLWLRGAMEPLELSGRELGSMMILTDISALIKAEQSAQLAAKQKSNFLTGVSHEIRTPMNAILGMSELMRTTPLNDTQHGYLSHIRGAAQSLLDVINDVLDFTKLEAQSFTLAPRAYEMISLVEDVVGIIQLRASEKRLRFMVYIQPDLPAMWFGDVGRIRQVLLNLLSNAVKYTPAGSVTLSITGQGSQDGYELRFDVADTGVGISRQGIEHLFEAFYQPMMHADTTGASTGLGLPIAKHLAEAMSGHIAVSSQEGVGSCFSLILPQQPHTDKPLLPPLPGDILIALVLPDESECHLITRSLNALSVSPVVCPVGDLEALVKARPEITHILIDAEQAQVYRKLMRALAVGRKLILVSEFYGHGNSEPMYGAGILFRPILITLLSALLTGREAERSGRVDTEERELGAFQAPGATALVVDDNQVNRVLAVEMLSHYQIKADTAGSGQEALRAVKARDYDIVFMDHMMPEMDGIQTTHGIRGMGEKYEALPIVALTANAVAGVRELYLSEGMDDYISKPIQVAQLNEVLLRWLPPSLIRHLEAAPEAGEGAPLGDAPPQDPLRALEAMDDMNIPPALSRLGGRSATYMTVLKAFLASAPAQLKRLDHACAKRDMATLKIESHAFKSALLSIGAEQLSQEAKAVELACEPRPEEAISLAPALSEDIGALLVRLNEATSRPEAEAVPDKPKGDVSALPGELGRVIDALAMLDHDEAAAIAARLGGFRYDDEIDGQIAKLAALVDGFAYDEAEAVARGVIAAEETAPEEL